MIASRRWFVARGRAVLGALLGFGLPILLGSCQADTLYDSTTPNAQPPTVTITEPSAGDSVQAGQSLALHVIATDQDGVAQIQINLTGAVQQTIVRSFSPASDSVALDTAVVVPSGTSGSLLVTARAQNVSGVSGLFGPVNVTVAAPDTVSAAVGTTARGGALFGVHRRDLAIF